MLPNGPLMVACEAVTATVPLNAQSAVILSDVLLAPHLNLLVQGAAPSQPWHLRKKETKSDPPLLTKKYDYPLV
jgi:hypothetical protein